MTNLKNVLQNGIQHFAFRLNGSSDIAFES